MICRRCLHTFKGKDRIAIQRGASVHKDKEICKKKLKPYGGK